MRQAVILVGGRGTRLGDIARETPKPLLPIVGDVRFLDLLLENFARHGVEDIILSAGHLAPVVEERYGGAKVRGARVRVVAEPEPAGTGGALRYVEDTLDDAFFMANGDAFFDFNYLALAQKLRPNDEGALALRLMPDARRYGRVEVENGRITGFHEKDASFEGPALINGGVYALRKSVLRLIERLPCSIETDIFPKLVASDALSAHEADGYFVDIGLPETLSRGRIDLPSLTRRRAILFDRDDTLNRDEGYTHKPEQLVWMPGAIEAIRRCNDSGQLAFVVSNQAGVARGLYNENDVHRFHAHMQDELRPHGAHIDAFYFCPHHGEGTIEEYANAEHPDRKPNPGMLRRALMEWSVSDAIMFGDTGADVGAGRAAGVHAEKVNEGELLSAVNRWLAQPAASKADDGLPERAARAQRWLFDIALPLWWERGFDRETGCFFEQLHADASPAADVPRRTRVQARQTIVYARAGRLGWPGPWRQAVEAGVKVLMDRCIRPDGGTRHLLGADGRPADERRDLYDLAFVTLALSEAAMALSDRPDLIAAAQQLVTWAEANWAHPSGGFREGDVTASPPRRQNPHMHMFEALLSLAEATGDAAALERASQLGDLLVDTLADTQRGTLCEFYDDTWHPASGEEGQIGEPGHHFEWSWLLHRWRALGGRDARDVAERLRVTAEVYGVSADDGIYDEVLLNGMPRTTTSRFWPHTERMKANLARFEITGDPRAAAAAAQAFDMLFTYCDTPTPGLWRDQRLPNGEFAEQFARASSFYHAIFALSELIRVSEARYGAG